MKTINNMAVSRALQAVYGWSSCAFLLSPSAFFSWGLVVGYNVVEYACVSILVTFYTQEAMKNHLAGAASLLCLQEGLASFAAILLVRFTCARFGRRFFALVVSTVSYIAAIMVLWSFARQEHQEKNVPLFIVISVLFALGKGGAHPLLKSFLEHKLCECYNTRSIRSQSNNEEEMKRAAICRIVWVQSAWIVGAAIAIFGFMKLQWVQVFHTSAIVMVSSGLLFLIFGSKSTARIGESVHKDAPTVPKRVTNMKWLMMFSCIAYSLVLATGNIFFQEQGTKMKTLKIKKHKPLRFSFMIVIKSAVNEIIILIFGLCGANKKQGTTLVRIGSGMVCAIICCVIAWKVEIGRKKGVKEENLMTGVAWLCPHYVLLGLVEGLAQNGLEELLAHDDEIETLMNPGRLSKDIVSCIGKMLGIPCILIVRMWLKNFQKDEAHLDRYYVMLAILATVFFCIYLCVAFVYMKLVPQHKEHESNIIGTAEVGDESTRV